MHPSRIAKERLNVVRHLRSNIAAFQADKRLERAQYNIVFAVDFAAVFAYVHRTFEATFIDRLPYEDKHRQFARLQMALDLVFESKRKLVLIPPYAVELINHVQLLREKYVFEALEVRLRMERQIRAALDELPRLKDFVQLLDRVDNDDNGTDLEWLRDMVLEIGKKHFPELFIVVRLIVINALPKLSQLIYSERLLPSVPYLFPTQDVEPVPDPLVTHQWLDKMNMVRKNLRPYQSLIDADACSYIVAANKSLAASKTVVLFFTPSRHVQSTFGRETIEVMPGVKSTLVRDLDYFLLTLLESAGSGSLEKHLADLMDLLGDVERAYTQVQEERTTTIAANILKDNESWSEIENLLLTIERSMSSRSRYNVETTKEANKTALKVLNRIVKYASERPDAIQDEVERLFGELNVEASLLERRVPRAQSLVVRDSMGFEFKDRQVEIRFRKLPAEMPFTVTFRDETVIGLAKRLQEAQGDVDVYGSLRAIVMNAVANENASAEHLLLGGCVAAMESKWKTSTELLKRGLVGAEGSTLTETLFLMALIHRKLFEPELATMYITEARRITGEGDPRVLIESSNVKWLQWHVAGRRTDAAARDILTTALTELFMAEKLAAQYDYMVREDLIAQIWNLQAFLYTERATIGLRVSDEDLKAAGRIIALLNKLPKKQWISRLLDTRGWYYLNWARTTDSMVLRERALENARVDFSRALKDPLLVAQKRALIEAHHDETIRLLTEPQ